MIRFGLILVVLVFSNTLFASTKSSPLVQKGYRYLTEQKFSQALKQFEEASKADSKDGQAYFFQGVVLNRLGRFEEAGKSLDKSKQYGAHPDFAFERGWAHLGQKEWREAIQILNEFEKKRPGRAQNSEFIGRAYFGLGEYQKAEKYLKKALKQDPKLKKTVDSYLSMMKGDEVPKDAKGEKPQNWKVYGNVGGTYNTNAINLGNNVTRPTNISRQESGLVSATLGGNYRFDLSNSGQLSLGHQVLSNLYEVSNKVNFLDNYTFLQFRYTFDPKKVLGVTVSNDFSIVQTAKFRNQIGLRPIFGWKLTDWLVSEVGYNFGFADYFFPSNANQDRDAHSHTAMLNNYFSVPKTKLRFRLGYSHLWNRAEGSDFDYDGNSLAFAVSHSFFKEITAEVLFAQSWNRYDNVNSLTASTKRKDDISNFFSQFTYPIIGKLKGFLHAGYTRNKANITTFDYRAWQGGGGFSATF